MIAEELLNKLESFGKEREGEYSDRFFFTIINRKDICALFLCSELDDDLIFIKDLKDMDDLKNVYKAISDRELK